MNELIKSGNNKYSRRIGTDYPGMILILIDQSKSMEDDKKFETASLAVNRVIYEIVLACQSGTEVKDRSYIGVIGYGESIKPVVGGLVSKIAENPKGITKLTQKVNDGAGGLVEIDIEMPYWVEPLADNGTPMADALEKAYNVANQWAGQNPESFPPVVINITDGEPNDFDTNNGRAVDTENAAKKLQQVSTLDGQLLLFNVHITGKQGGSILLPSEESELSNSYAKLLFRISSVIPSSMLGDAQTLGFQPKNNARGFIFNADTENLIKLLTFGSSAHTR